MKRGNVAVGQVLLVRDGETVPADVVCLACGLPQGVAFVRTVRRLVHTVRGLCAHRASP